VALALVVLAIRRRFAAGDDDVVTYWIRVGATTGLVAIAAQAFVEFSLQMPGNAALCVVLLAIALHEAPSVGRGLTPRHGGRVASNTAGDEPTPYTGSPGAGREFKPRLAGRGFIPRQDAR